MYFYFFTKIKLLRVFYYILFYIYKDFKSHAIQYYRYLIPHCVTGMAIYIRIYYMGTLNIIEFQLFDPMIF